MANILYLGSTDEASTSMHRAGALIRLGHIVEMRDPYKLMKAKPAWKHFIHYRTGYMLLQKEVEAWINNIVNSSIRPDFIWVDSGELFGKGCLRALKTLNCPVVLYNVDDPTGKRDGNRFNSLLKAITLYDLIVVVRKESENECMLLGAKQVMRVFRSYDEVAHQPFSHLSDIPEQFKSEVAFIGTWMRHEKRDEFLLDLVKQGIPVSIWGNRWQKSPYWSELKQYYRGKALSGRDYVAAMQGSKICLGLLSKGNRDLHTQRSLEVTYAGGLFCAERTTEHEDLYIEGKEAMFWSGAAECSTVCKELLTNDSKREAIRLGGMHKIRSLKLGNEDICREVINSLNV